MFEEVTIGECRLILGDCREVLPLLPPCDLILTDPPYGIGAYKTGTMGGLADRASLRTAQVVRGWKSRRWRYGGAGGAFAC